MAFPMGAVIAIQTAVRNMQTVQQLNDGRRRTSDRLRRLAEEDAKERSKAATPDETDEGSDNGAK